MNFYLLAENPSSNHIESFILLVAGFLVVTTLVISAIVFYAIKRTGKPKSDLPRPNSERKF